MDSPTILTPRDWPSHPAYVHPEYRSSVKRGPTRPLIPLKEKLRDQYAPVYGADDLGPLDHDLTRNAVKNGEPLGERIVVTGRVLDEGGKPVRNTLVEVWQANAAGRYVHKVDQHDAPLDPNFLGAGRCLTDDEGRYRFLTIKPARIRGATIRMRGARITSTSRCSATTSVRGWSRRCTSPATRCSRTTRSSRARRRPRAIA